AITERVLSAVTPFTIKLVLEALANLEQRDKLVSTQWRWRIERARYEAELAERRYEEVDPSNRLIASTLEKRWNDAMQRMADLEAELATFERQAMRSVTEEQKQQILQLGRDFPRLWKAKTTSTCDRKRMLRLLIRGTQNQGCCACKFAGRAEQLRCSRYVNARSDKMRSAIRIRSLLKSVIWPKYTTTERSSSCSTVKV